MKLKEFNSVFIIPTGIGCEIGGHAGDATPAARLIASISDKILLHPNVVNASDLNEMPENTLYVEGSMLDRFLEGEIGLKEVNSNKILLVVNDPIKPETINAVNAMRVLLGINIEIKVLKNPLKLTGRIENGIAAGDVINWESLCQEMCDYNKYYSKFDVLAIATPIDVSNEVSLKYFREGGVNPWGGVEAKCSKLISEQLGIPVAHAPIESDDTKSDSELFNIAYNEVVDPRMAPEIIATTYVCCVLKGLHKAPRVGNQISVEDIDCLITPAFIYGRPHTACLKAGIPIVAVKENKSVLTEVMHPDFIVVENYLEAAGVVSAIKSGISLESLRRPINVITVP